MLIILICYFIIYKTAIVNISKKKRENDEPSIDVKRSCFPVINSVNQQESSKEANKATFDDDFEKNQASSFSEILMDQTYEKMINDSLKSTDRSCLNELTVDTTTFSATTAESLNEKELDSLLFSDIEPSLKTLHPEITALTEDIFNQDLDKCIFQKQNQLKVTDIEHNNSITSLTNIEVDEETLSANDSSSENSKTDICTESSIKTFSPEQSQLQNKPRDEFKCTHLNFLLANTTTQALNSESFDDYFKIVYKKIVKTISDKIPENKFDWHVDRLEIINKMRHNIKQNYSEDYDLFGAFMSYIDQKFLKQLDKMYLRSYSKLIVYGLNEYQRFNNNLTHFIMELKIEELMSQYFFLQHNKVFQVLSVQFLLLFEFFPHFPELMTLGSLFDQGQDYLLLIYIRFIHLILLENKLRLQQIRPVILFLIKKSFATPKKRNKEINLALKEKFSISQFYLVRSVCEKDHSDLVFFMWEFNSIKLRSMRHDGKTNDGYVYKITIFNIEHFRVVFLTFVYQYFMFIEQYNIGYQRYKEIIDSSFDEFNCIFCSFKLFSRSIDADVSRINKIY